jgi:hypothetical protein
VYQELLPANQGAFVALDQIVSICSATIAFAGLLLVAIQMRGATRQREAESIVKLSDINRELLSLGFDHPALFKILEDAPNADSITERRYLQLWLNQLLVIHLYLKHSVVDNDLRQSLERSLADFMTLKNMRQHWQHDRTTYPDSFQKLVDGIIEKGEPPVKAARHESDAQHLAGDFLERRAGHPHEGFAVRRGEHGVLAGIGNVSLHEHIAVVGQDGGRTQPAVTQSWKLPILSDNFFNRHNIGNFGFLRSLKQNHSFCFTHDVGSAFV